MKLSGKKNRKGFVMERHYSDGMVDLKITCIDSTAEVDKTITGLTAKMSAKIESIFDTSTTANEVKTKLEALRIF